MAENTPEEQFLTERAQLDRDFSRISGTEGFSGLSDKQQKIIRQSLYIQQRHDRENIPLSQRRLGEQKYRVSHKHIFNWFCHGAIANLESERGLGILPPEIPENFFNARYQLIQNQTDLESLLEKQGFPCVVHISSSSDGLKNSSQAHSFLALGHDRQGQILIWDKEGYTQPYRVTTLNKIMAEYPYRKPDYSYWGIRSLKKSNPNGQ